MRQLLSLLPCIALFIPTGCSFAGERAASGECPAGETCSSLTPGGLVFRGAPLSDNLGQSTLATAVGGWQTIEVAAPDGRPLPAILDRFSVTAGPLAAFAVTDVRAPRLTLRALAPAPNGWLRITDGMTGELFDRVAVTAAAIDHVSVEPELLYAIGSGDAEPRTPVLLRGAPGQLTVRLLSASGEALTDEGATLSVPTGDTLRPLAWDQAEVSTTSDHTVLTVQVGASRFDVPLRAVDRPDTIELLPRDTSAPIVIDGREAVCFLATAGGDPVESLAWRFVGSASVGTGPVDDTGSIIPLPSSCIEVDGVALGPATLTASLGPTSFTVALDVRGLAPVRGALLAPGPHRVFRSLVLGERAASAD